MKRARRYLALFIGATSLLQPALHGVCTMFFFPGLKHLVVAPLGFYNLTGLRVLVELHLALPTWCIELKTPLQIQGTPPHVGRSLTA